VKLDMVKRMVCAKAQKVNKRWDELLDKLIDDHANATRSESQHVDEESDFIDLLLSVQQEYKLTRDHIKAQLVVRHLNKLRAYPFFLASTIVLASVL
jgi:hypothetical protein